MTHSPTESSKTELINALIDDDFLAAAQLLREIQDETPDAFVTAAKIAGVGRRKAYALVQINRCFAALNVEPTLLRRIGWSKLQTLCQHITVDNHQQLLSLAQSVCAHELSAILRDPTYSAGKHCVVLYLSSKQYDVFQHAVLAHGGKKSPRGLTYKEMALVQALTEKASA
jgi:hypothetical protein